MMNNLSFQSNEACQIPGKKSKNAKITEERIDESINLIDAALSRTSMVSSLASSSYYQSLKKSRSPEHFLDLSLHQSQILSQKSPLGSSKDHSKSSASASRGRSSFHPKKHNPKDSAMGREVSPSVEVKNSAMFGSPSDSATSRGNPKFGGAGSRSKEEEFWCQSGKSPKVEEFHSLGPLTPRMRVENNSRSPDDTFEDFSAGRGALNGRETPMSASYYNFSVLQRELPNITEEEARNTSEKNHTKSSVMSDSEIFGSDWEGNMKKEELKASFGENMKQGKEKLRLDLPGNGLEKKEEREPEEQDKMPPSFRKNSFVESSKKEELDSLNQMSKIIQSLCGTGKLEVFKPEWPWDKEGLVILDRFILSEKITEDKAANSKNALMQKALRSGLGKTPNTCVAGDVPSYILSFAIKPQMSSMLMKPELTPKTNKFKAAKSGVLMKNMTQPSQMMTKGVLSLPESSMSQYGGGRSSIKRDFQDTLVKRTLDFQEKEKALKPITVNMDKIFEKMLEFRALSQTPSKISSINNETEPIPFHGLGEKDSAPCSGKSLKLKPEYEQKPSKFGFKQFQIALACCSRAINANNDVHFSGPLRKQDPSSSLKISVPSHSVPILEFNEKNKMVGDNQKQDKFLKEKIEETEMAMKPHKEIIPSLSTYPENFLFMSTASYILNENPSYNFMKVGELKPFSCKWICDVCPTQDSNKDMPNQIPLISINGSLKCSKNNKNDAAQTCSMLGNVLKISKEDSCEPITKKRWIRMSHFAEVLQNDKHNLKDLIIKYTSSKKPMGSNTYLEKLEGTSENSASAKDKLLMTSRDFWPLISIQDNLSLNPKSSFAKKAKQLEGFDEETKKKLLFTLNLPLNSKGALKSCPQKNDEFAKEQDGSSDSSPALETNGISQARAIFPEEKKLKCLLAGILNFLEQRKIKTDQEKPESTLSFILNTPKNDLRSYPHASMELGIKGINSMPSHPLNTSGLFDPKEASMNFKSIDFDVLLGKAHAIIKQSENGMKIESELGLENLQKSFKAFGSKIKTPSHQDYSKNTVSNPNNSLNTAGISEFASSFSQKAPANYSRLNDIQMARNIVKENHKLCGNYEEAELKIEMSSMVTKSELFPKLEDSNFSKDPYADAMKALNTGGIFEANASQLEGSERKSCSLPEKTELKGFKKQKEEKNVFLISIDLENRSKQSFNSQPLQCGQEMGIKDGFSVPSQSFNAGLSDAPTGAEILREQRQFPDFFMSALASGDAKPSEFPESMINKLPERSSAMAANKGAMEMRRDSYGARDTVDLFKKLEMSSEVCEINMENKPQETRGKELQQNQGKPVMAGKNGEETIQRNLNKESFIPSKLAPLILDEVVPCPKDTCALTDSAIDLELKLKAIGRLDSRGLLSEVQDSMSLEQKSLNQQKEKANILEEVISEEKKERNEFNYSKGSLNEQGELWDPENVTMEPNSQNESSFSQKRADYVICEGQEKIKNEKRKGADSRACLKMEGKIRDKTIQSEEENEDRDLCHTKNEILKFEDPNQGEFSKELAGNNDIKKADQAKITDETKMKLEKSEFSDQNMSELDSLIKTEDMKPNMRAFGKKETSGEFFDERNTFKINNDGLSEASRMEVLEEMKEHAQRENQKRIAMGLEGKVCELEKLKSDFSHEANKGAGDFKEGTKNNYPQDENEIKKGEIGNKKSNSTGLSDITLREVVQKSEVNFKNQEKKGLTAENSSMEMGESPKKFAQNSNAESENPLRTPQKASDELGRTPNEEMYCNQVKSLSTTREFKKSRSREEEQLVQEKEEKQLNLLNSVKNAINEKRGSLKGEQCPQNPRKLVSKKSDLQLQYVGTRNVNEPSFDEKFGSENIMSSGSSSRKVPERQGSLSKRSEDAWQSLPLTPKGDPRNQSDLPQMSPLEKRPKRLRGHMSGQLTGSSDQKHELFKSFGGSEIDWAEELKEASEMAKTQAKPEEKILAIFDQIKDVVAGGFCTQELFQQILVQLTSLQQRILDQKSMPSSDHEIRLNSIQEELKQIKKILDALSGTNSKGHSSEKKRGFESERASKASIEFGKFSQTSRQKEIAKNKDQFPDNKYSDSRNTGAKKDKLKDYQYFSDFTRNKHNLSPSNFDFGRNKSKNTSPSGPLQKAKPNKSETL